MTIFKTKIDSQSENFINNKNQFGPLVKKMNSIKGRAEKVSERRREKFTERGQLTPRERLLALLDPKFLVIKDFRSDCDVVKYSLNWIISSL